MSENLLGGAAPEAAAPDAGAAPEATPATTATPATPEAAAAERFDFVLDKYRTEGRTEAQAMELQAKSYNELQTKLGSFTGAPENYTADISQELQDAGVIIDKDDPMLEAAQEFAKTAGMNQEGFAGMIELYAQQLLGEQQAQVEQRGEEMKLLGANAEKRIANINAWASANLDAETVAGLQEASQSAASVKAIEQLISKTRGVAVAPEAAPASSLPSAQKVSDMQFEKDGNGQRRINTDPAFKKEYERARDLLHGTHEHRTMVN